MQKKKKIWEEAEEKQMLYLLSYAVIIFYDVKWEEIYSPRSEHSKLYTHNINALGEGFMHINNPVRFL